MSINNIENPVKTVEKKPEKVKLSKEERAAKKAAAELEKKQKAEERAAKKAAAELEKKQKAEERAAKKAAAELEKKRKAEERAAKKAAKEEKKQQVNEPSLLQSKIADIIEQNASEENDVPEKEQVQNDEQVSPLTEEEDSEEPEEEDQCLPFDSVAAALVDKALESSNDSSVDEKDMNVPPNSPRFVFVGPEPSPIGDDDSVECDFTAVMEKLQKMKAIILTTRENLKQLEACYADVANVLGADATL